jgi:hypothetical protein
VRKSELEREAFIWDDLISRGSVAVDQVRKLWRKERYVPRMAFSWPSEHLPTKDGKIITHIVSFAIPRGMSTFDGVLLLAKRTKAYAVLLIEKQNDTLDVLLESPHGTRSWALPIRRHGDVDVLEKEKASKDARYLGILWRPSMTEN